MHLILTGATGLCGSAVLDAMIKMKDVTKISIISRRPVKMAEDAKDPRINVILHKDFEKYDSELLGQIKDANGCVWALGISQSQVGKEEYIKITKDFALRAAEAFQTLGTAEKPFDFVYVSGEGTTHNPGSFTPIFGRIKGETELALADMRRTNPSFRAVTIRPAFIDAAAHDAIKPYVPPVRWTQGAMVTVLGPPIRSFFKGNWSPTGPLGRVMTELAMGKWEGKMDGTGVEKIGQFSVIGNVGFRRLAGLDK